MKFKVGVIGATGYIGTPYRSEIREATGDAEIVALCARRRDRLKVAALTLKLTDSQVEDIFHNNAARLLDL